MARTKQTARRMNFTTRPPISPEPSLKYEETSASEEEEKKISTEEIINEQKLRIRDLEIQVRKLETSLSTCLVKQRELEIALEQTMGSEQRKRRRNVETKQEGGGDLSSSSSRDRLESLYRRLNEKKSRERVQTLLQRLTEQEKLEHQG